MIQHDLKVFSQQTDNLLPYLRSASYRLSLNGHGLGALCFKKPYAFHSLCVI